MIGFKPIGRGYFGIPRTTTDISIRIWNLEARRLEFPGKDGLPPAPESQDRTLAFALSNEPRKLRFNTSSE